MSSDPRLLELLHGAVDRVTSLQGELRHTRRPRLAVRSFEAAPMVGAVGLYRWPEDEELVTRWRVVLGSAGRYRFEPLSSPSPDRSFHQPELQVDDGVRLVEVIRGEFHIRRRHGCMAIERLADPSWVLTHDLETVGEASAGDRAVLLVKATARPFRTRSGSASDMAGERDLVVDAERGFLHRDAALVQGEPYDVLELNEVTVDGDPAADAFSVTIPPGATVTDTSNEDPRRFAHLPPGRRRWSRFLRRIHH